MKLINIFHILNANVARFVLRKLLTFTLLLGFNVVLLIKYPGAEILIFYTMAAILTKAWEVYKILFEDLPDERTKSWFLVAKPYQALTILGLYLMFVMKWGPKYMKGRPAYNLDKVLIVYNFLQVLACVYIFYNAVVFAWGWHYKWICEPVDFTTSKRAMGIASTVYMYYITKIVDLLDTIFFVLRKKYNQVSFLHIYHHTGMVLLVWGGITYLPGGHGTLIGVINTFVHIVMYSYYLYTVVNPSAKQSLWWKKYITQLQILQFFWCVVHMGAIVFIPDCEYPRWTSAVFLPQNLFILVLFIDFYIKTYIRKPKTQQIANLKSRNADKQITTNGYASENGIINHELNSKIVIQNSIDKNEKSTNINNNYEAQSFLNDTNRYVARNETQRQNETHISQNGSLCPDNTSPNNYHSKNEDEKHGKAE